MAFAITPSPLCDEFSTRFDYTLTVVSSVSLTVQCTPNLMVGMPKSFRKMRFRPCLGDWRAYPSTHKPGPAQPRFCVEYRGFCLTRSLSLSLLSAAVLATLLGFLAYRRATTLHQTTSDRTDSRAPATSNSNGDPKQNPAGMQALDVVPFDAELRNITQAFILTRRTDIARDLLHNYMDQHPDDPQATFLYGLTFHREQKYDQALTYFSKATELAPTYHLPQYFAGWALYNLGNLESARESFESYLQYNPDHADSHFGLGLIDLDADALDAAKAHFQRSIDVLTAQAKPADPQDMAKARTRLAEVYERQDDLQRAKAELIQATSTYPDNYEGLYKLYRVLVRLDENDEAERIRRLYVATKERVRPGTGF